MILPLPMAAPQRPFLSPSPRPPHDSPPPPPHSRPRALHHTCCHLAFCLVNDLSAHPNTGVQLPKDTGLIYSVLHPTSGLGPGTQEALHMCAMDKATLGWLGLGIRDEALLFTCTRRKRDYHRISSTSSQGVHQGACALTGFNGNTTQQILGHLLFLPGLHHLPHSPRSVTQLGDLLRPRTAHHPPHRSPESQ